MTHQCLQDHNWQYIEGSIKAVNRNMTYILVGGPKPAIWGAKFNRFPTISIKLLKSVFFLCIVLPALLLPYTIVLLSIGKIDTQTNLKEINLKIEICIKMKQNQPKA